MFPFETSLTTDDEVAVLAAYAAAEELADQERKAQEAVARAERKANGQTAAAAPVEPPAESATELTDDADMDAEAEDEGNTAAAVQPRAAVWIKRLRDVAGIARDRLAPIHGRLIAHGLLQFQLLGQTEGVVYRLTPAGRQALTATAASSVDLTDAA